MYINVLEIVEVVLSWNLSDEVLADALSGRAGLLAGGISD